MTGAPNNLGLDPFPDPVGHFGAHWQAVRRCRRCGVAGGERVPPAPLGWYSIQDSNLNSTINRLLYSMQVSIFRVKLSCVKYKQIQIMTRFQKLDHIHFPIVSSVFVRAAKIKWNCIESFSKSDQSVTNKRELKWSRNWKKMTPVPSQRWISGKGSNLIILNHH